MDNNKNVYKVAYVMASIAALLFVSAGIKHMIRIAGLKRCIIRIGRNRIIINNGKCRAGINYGEIIHVGRDSGGDVFIERDGGENIWISAMYLNDHHVFWRDLLLAVPANVRTSSTDYM